MRLYPQLRKGALRELPREPAEDLVQLRRQRRVRGLAEESELPEKEAVVRQHDQPHVAAAHRALQLADERPQGVIGLADPACEARSQSCQVLPGVQACLDITGKKRLLRNRSRGFQIGQGSPRFMAGKGVDPEQEALVPNQLAKMLACLLEDPLERRLALRPAPTVGDELCLEKGAPRGANSRHLLRRGQKLDARGDPWVAASSPDEVDGIELVEQHPAQTRNRRDVIVCYERRPKSLLATKTEESVLARLRKRPVPAQERESSGQQSRSHRARGKRAATCGQYL